MASISCCPRSFSTYAPVTSRRSLRYKCFAKNRLCTPPCPAEANVGPDPASQPHKPGRSTAPRSGTRADGDSGKAGNRLDCLPGPEGVARGVSAEQATAKGRLCLEVVIQEGENLERALRRFKRKVQRSGLYSELRKRRFYEKPSAQRKRKREAAIRRERRRQRRTASRR